MDRKRAIPEQVIEADRTKKEGVVKHSGSVLKRAVASRRVTGRRVYQLASFTGRCWQGRCQGHDVAGTGSGECR